MRGLLLVVFCGLANAEVGGYFGGEFKGTCGDEDGYYYMSETEFVTCKGEKFDKHNCAPGTRSPPISQYPDAGIYRDIVFCGENLVDTGYTWRKQPGVSAGAGGGANNGVKQSINDNRNSNNNKNSNNGNGYGNFKLPFKYVLAPIHLSQLTNGGIEMPGYPPQHIVYTPVLTSYAPVPMQPAQPSPPTPAVPTLPPFRFSPAPVPSSMFAPSMSYSPAVAPMTSYPPAATPSTSYSPRTAPVTSYRPANMFPYSPSKSEPIMDTPSSSYVPTKSYVTDENNHYVSSATHSRYGLQSRKRGKSFTFYFLNSHNRDNEGQRYYR